MSKVQRQAEQAQQALGDNLATAERHRSDLAATNARIESIEAAWREGDDSASSAEMTALRDDAMRSTHLLAAAEKSVKVARSGLVRTDPSLADAVAWALGRTFNGIPVLPVTVEPTMPKTLTSPVAYVVHADANDDKQDKQDKRTVHFVLHAPSYVTAPDADEFRDLLRYGGTVMDPHDRTRFKSTPHGGLWEHRLRLQVLAAQAEHPHWADPRSAALGAARKVADAFLDSLHGATIRTNFPVDGKFASARVLRSASAGDGFTDTTVEIEADLRTSVHGRTQAASADVRNDLRRVASSHAETWANSGPFSSHVRSTTVAGDSTGVGSQTPVRVAFVLRSRNNALTLAEVAV